MHVLESNLIHKIGKERESIFSKVFSEPFKTEFPDQTVLIRSVTNTESAPWGGYMES